MIRRNLNASILGLTALALWLPSDSPSQTRQNLRPITTITPVVEPLSRFPAPETSLSLVLNQSTTYTLPAAGEGLANSRIILANVGRTEIINPWIVANGQRDWFDTPSIVQDVVRRARVPDEVPFLAWEFLSTNTYHFKPAEAYEEMHDLVKFLNVYGYGFCDDHAANLEILWREAGFPQVRSANVGSHVVAEIFHQDHWQMMDANLEIFYPSRHHPGLASVEELIRDNRIMKQVSGGFSNNYTTTEPVYFNARHHTSTTMAMILRPGESLERAWYNWAGFHSLITTQSAPLFGNGRLFYQPTIDQLFEQPTSVTVRALERGGLGFFPDQNHKNSTWNKRPALILSMAAPYPFLDGAMEIPIRSLNGRSGGLTIRVRRASRPNGPYTIVKTAEARAKTVTIPLKSMIGASRHQATYGLEIEIVPDQNVTFGAPRIMIDFQCAPIALPGLQTDQPNTISARFDNPGQDGRLYIEHRITRATNLFTRSLPAVEHPLPPQATNWITWDRDLILAPDHKKIRKTRPRWKQAWKELICETGQPLDIDLSQNHWTDVLARFTQAIHDCDDQLPEPPPESKPNTENPPTSS